MKNIFVSLFMAGALLAQNAPKPEGKAEKAMGTVGKGVDTAAEKTVDGTKAAAGATTKGAKRAGKATAHGVKKVAKATETGARKATATAGEGLSKAGETMKKADPKDTTVKK